jgi:hypothetical protein
MAARRLIMVLLVLLFISSIAAALVPIERSSRDQSSTTTTQLPSPAPTGKLVIRRIDSSKRGSEEVRMHVGDELQLTVDNERPDQVEIPALDQVEPVDLGAPAHFDILADQARVYPVRLVEANRTIARIVVAKPARRPNGSGRRA